MPERTRQDDASSLLQYLQPLAIRHGKLMESANTCRSYNKKYVRNTESYNKRFENKENKRLL